LKGTEDVWLFQCIDLRRKPQTHKSSTWATVFLIERQVLDEYSSAFASAARLSELTGI